MPSSIHKIALIPGDGAGPIVLKEMRKILEIINSHQKTQVQAEEFPFNGKYFLRHHQAFGSDFLMRLKTDFKGLILGALGDQTIQNQNYVKMMRHSVEKTMELKIIMQSFTLVHPKKTPLRGLNSGDISVLLFRDKASVFGEKQGLSLFEGEKEETVIESQVQTVNKAAKDLELILGFIHKRYQGNVTLVLAKQAFPFSSKIWERLFSEKISAYPNLKGLVLDYSLFLRKFLADPRGRNVIICPGYCGEFMTSLFSELTDSPLSSVQCQFNEKERFFAEPFHGAISSLKDHSRVSPFGALLTLALTYLMLDMRGTGRLVRDAVLKAYENNWLTPDMDGSMTAEAVGDFISAWIDKKLTEEQKLFTV
jgi:tartrate dehydrogenase/decarboxylase / D-malate dehydrogenase